MIVSAFRKKKGFTVGKPECKVKSKVKRSPMRFPTSKFPPERQTVNTLSFEQ